MITAIIIALLIVFFIFLWWIIGKYPLTILNVFPSWRERTNIDHFLEVFSGTTSDGTEAEFIDENLPHKDKVVRFLRLLLAGVYTVVVVCVLYYIGI